MKLDIENPIGVQLGFDCIGWYMNFYACNLIFAIFYVNLLCDTVLVVHNKCLFFTVRFQAFSSVVCYYMYCRLRKPSMNNGLCIQIYSLPTSY
jgi:hypothetical protein